METNKISAKEAIELIQKEELNSSYEVVFNEEAIDAFEALLLSRNGILVPENLIEYDDEKIDYSDIPAITDEDIASGKIKWTSDLFENKVEPTRESKCVCETRLEISEEIDKWLKAEQIDVNALLSSLLDGFYKTLKTVS